MNALYSLLMQAGPVSSEAGGTTGAAADQGSPLNLVFLLVVLFGIMYVFLIMPQKKREKKHRAMLAELKKNDRIITAGGIHGIVMAVKEDVASIKVDDSKDVKITISIGSITQIVSKEEQESEEKK